MEKCIRVRQCNTNLRNINVSDLERYPSYAYMLSKKIQAAYSGNSQCVKVYIYLLGKRSTTLAIWLF
jgi:hypothetical protein